MILRGSSLASWVMRPAVSLRVLALEFCL